MSRKRKRVLWGVLAAFVLVVIVAAASGKSDKATSTISAVRTATPSTGTHASKATRPTRTKFATQPKPRPKRKPVARVAPSGFAYSTASNAVVMAQPAPGSCHASGSGTFSEPDPKCTPGALNPAVTQSTLNRTICVSGWTDVVRPSERVTEPEKAASMAAYGDSGSMHAYEYDHLIPLELGGATNDPRNLWPEPGGSPNAKDSVENALHRQVCDGQLSLARAQRIIVTDWVGRAHSTGSSSAGGTLSTRTTTSAHTPAPATASNTGSPAIVHAGAFCAPEGASGQTTRGTPMVCEQASDGRDRWRHA